MARPISLTEQQVKKLLALHSKGYSDGEIAEQLETSRYVIMRFRKAHDLKPNRKKGDRGLGNPKENESYYMYTQRVLRNQLVAAAMRKAVRKLLHQGRITFESAFVALGMEPARMIHPAPPPYTQDPEKMTFLTGEKIAKIEQYIERAGLAGVPGSAILELVKVIKSRDEDMKEYWAEQAVLESGLVNTTATVQMVDQCVINPISIQVFMNKWEEEIEQIREFTRNKMPAKKVLRGFSKLKEHISRTGKKGKQGGVINISQRTAWLGAAGY